MATYDPRNKEIRDSAPKRCTCGEKLGRPTYGDAWGELPKESWYWYVTHEFPGEPNRNPSCALVWCSDTKGKYTSYSLRGGTPEWRKDEDEDGVEQVQEVKQYRYRPKPEDAELEEWLRAEREALRKLGDTND